MAKPIIYDVSRLFLCTAARAPRGIDRLDLAIAEHLFADWPGDVWGCMPTVLGERLFDRERVLRGLAYLQEVWAEARPAAEDGAFSQLTSQLNHRVPTPPRRRAARWRGPFALIRRTGYQVGRRAIRHAPRDAIYLNVGQLAWGIPVLTHWLRRRRDLKAIFMVHDVIPIDHPDLVIPMSRRAHHWLMAAVARHASGLLLTTRAAGDAVTRRLDAMSVAGLPADIGPVPIPPAFLEPAPHRSPFATTTYFVICGAIEPRKNLGVLLDAWEMLAARHGTRTPQLVIAGTPASRAAPILARITASLAPRGPLVWARGLSTPALRQVIGHARALLMPSLAEGYGMPVAEALAIGTPVIASDIPPHVEIARDHAAFCPPRDATAWCMAIERLTFDEAAHQAARVRAAGYTPLPADCYFRRIETFLQRF
ncbi:MAG TPA: glycosyltransferase family 1 protein [Acetobacteraceae bacterium]|nr:glycosyltransferase family 1 protein [Acetobacteraceae bacterium]